MIATANDDDSITIIDISDLQNIRKKYLFVGDGFDYRLSDINFYSNDTIISSYINKNIVRWNLSMI